MKKIIFVGGIQYSGKTTFCKQLEKTNRKQIKHISLDEYFNRFASDKRLLHEAIDKYGLGDYLNIENISRKDIFEKVISTCALMHVTYKEVKPFKKKPSTYLIEGVLANEISREILFQTLQIRLEDVGVFNNVAKEFIYFDLGLNLSLQRYNTSSRKQIKTMIHNEFGIIDTYSNQEFPTDDELRNLKISIIKNQSEYKREFLRLQKTK